MPNQSNFYRKYFIFAVSRSVGSFSRSRSGWWFSEGQLTNLPISLDPREPVCGANPAGTKDYTYRVHYCPHSDSFLGDR